MSYGPDDPAIATYVYTKPSGEPVAEKRRYLEKRFQWWYPNGVGWASGKPENGGVSLYRLHEIVKCNVAFIVEGEKDADRLAAIDWSNVVQGVVGCTTAPDGANTWHVEQYGPYFAGKRVYVIPDTDASGAKYEKDVISSVSKYADQVRVVRLSPDSKDVSEFLDHHTEDELTKLIQAASLVAKPNAAFEVDAAGLKLKRGSEVVVRERRWLVQDHLPDETLVILAGETGRGKTTVCISWAADITTGRVPVVGGEREKRDVMILTNEDDESRIVRQFLAHGGDINRLHIEDDDSDYPWGLGDLVSLEARIAELNPAIVVIDSLTTHKPDGVKLNSSDDIPKALVRLRKIATAHHCAIVVIHHDNKSRTVDPLEKIANSKAIINTARHSLLVAQDPERPEDLSARVIVVVNTNITALGKANYRFRLVEEVKEVMAVWEGLTSVRENNVLTSAEDGGSQGDAEDFLNNALKDEREDCTKLKRMAEDGFGIKPWTLHRAAIKLKVDREYTGFGRERKVYWKLPPKDSSQAITKEGGTNNGIDDTIVNNSQKTVIDGVQSIKTPIFDAGLAIDDSNGVSVIDGVIDCGEKPLLGRTPRCYQE